MKRLFIAFDIDEGLKETLRSETEKFRKELARDAQTIRWVDSKNYHMTVAFLGDTSEENIPSIARSLSEAHSAATSTIELGPPMLFPGMRRPRVLVRGLRRGAQPLIETAESLRKTLEERAIDFDRKPFRPHLTVGYFRKRPVSVIRPIAEQWLKQLLNDGHPGTVRRIALYESALSEGGPSYRVLSERPIGRM